ncbi:zinc finger and SCAN domain-containing protein 26-like isoform X2 [Anopheles coustani]|uniref:zinc finger and SCAN domain-containing protein 26-like isoform X2 n=1 Tax=Anopheles coustani TaxID=139045 RepID=UPI0026597CE2|nr:zinc finger and SCAN domain-containing protein 26-like isoform X2 [Anopheles coustani]
MRLYFPYSIPTRVQKADRLLSVCLECVNRINTVRKMRQLFIENNRKLQAWLQDNASVDDKNDTFEVYEVSMPENGLARQDTEAASDKNLTNIGEKQCEELLSTHASITDKNTEKIMILNIEEAYEDDFGVLLTIEPDPENSSGNDTPEVPRLDEQAVPATTVARIPVNKCYFCGRIFQDAIEFTHHLPEHFTQVPYTCKECNGLVFKSVREASKHIGMHDNSDRPFQCRVCPLRFATRCNSLTHERKMHRFKTKQKPTADNSGQGGRQRAKRKPCKNDDPSERSVSHTCDICQKNFTAKKNLTRHLMVHTGEMPFKCTQCKRSFRQAGQLKAHHAVHQSQDSHKCDQCDATYRNFPMLAKHRKAAHPQRSKTSRRRQS